jgi:hypothetical protein
VVRLSETVSTRLPLELVRLMEGEARAKGVSLSMLLREIVEAHYGIKLGKPAVKPFIVELQEALEALGEAKFSSCPSKEGCPLKELKLEPKPLLCALCQIHDHSVGLLTSSTYNPYQKVV